MATRLHDQKEDLLSGAIARLHDKLDKRQAKLGEAFLRHYYRSVAPVDLVDRDALDLYGAALAHLRFGERREAGKAKVRVYNPQIEQHGWQSTHTTIEIITDDMPFLVDSVTMAINRLGLIIHLVIHPVLPVTRGDDQALTNIGAPDSNGGGALAESFMHVEVDRQSDPARLDEIREALERALADVRAAVEDWKPILGKIDEALEDLDRGSKVIPADDLAEARAFLEWIADDHFTFIGYRCYDLVTVKGKDQLHRIAGSALGILKHREDGKLSESFAVLPDDVKRQARLPNPLMITKANSRSTVHRPVYLDYLGVKRFDKKGKVIGEHRFLGLFTSAAYNRNPRSIPLLRHKVRRLIERADLAPSSHGGKAFINILETYPRDELFQTDEDHLFDTVMETLHLQERQRIRLFARRDTFARFVSCLVYVPRERYNTELRRRFQDILEEELGGRRPSIRFKSPNRCSRAFISSCACQTASKKILICPTIEARLDRNCPLLEGWPPRGADRYPWRRRGESTVWQLWFGFPDRLSGSRAGQGRRSGCRSIGQVLLAVKKSWRFLFFVRLKMKMAGFVSRSAGEAAAFRYPTLCPSWRIWGFG